MEEFMKINDMPIYMTVVDPAYDVTVFICDQYELEKLPK